MSTYHLLKKLSFYTLLSLSIVSIQACEDATASSDNAAEKKRL
ncbi:hypothetical protein [Psychrosphaera haliotis]|nr:hypothetical protein [Psychrosphaera haliotis]